MMGVSVKTWLCLMLVKDLLVSAWKVDGSVGGTVTLPCSYLVSKATTSMCWGKGTCPTSGCTDEIIRTDGQQVTQRKSDRYQLLGDLSQGNVSLTIMELMKEDEGTYCCRVEIPGWFNDEKNKITLMVHKGPAPTSSTSKLNTWSPGFKDAPDYKPLQSDGITSTATSLVILGTLKGNQRLDLEEPEISTVHNGSFNPVTAGVIITILLIILVLSLSVWRYYKIRNKDKQRNTGELTLEGLHGRNIQAQQNIYSL